MNIKKIISVTIVPIFTTILLYVSFRYLEPIYINLRNNFLSWEAYCIYYIYTFIIALGIRIGFLLNRNRQKNFSFNVYALILAIISLGITYLFTLLYIYNDVIQIASGTLFFLSLFFLFD